MTFVVQKLLSSVPIIVRGKMEAEEKDSFTPKIVGYLCNWCTYAAADLAGSSKLEISPSLNVIRVMCSSRVDYNLVLTTFFGGADGILIAGCHPGDCHYDKGNYFYDINRT